MGKRKQSKSARLGTRTEPDTIETDTLGVPNLNFSQTPTKDKPFPVMCLLSRNEDGELVGAFVDPRHGQTHWTTWAQAAPSWLDAVRFVQLCQEDAEISRLLKKCVAAPAPGIMRQVQSQVLQLFNEKYLPELIVKFRGQAPLLAKWLLVEEHYKKVDAEIARRGRKRPAKVSP